MGSQFGFVVEIAYILPRERFLYRWTALAQSQSIFCSSLHSTSEETGGAQEVRRGHSGIVNPDCQRDIL